jgi:hypothetical protein
MLRWFDFNKLTEVGRKDAMVFDCVVWRGETRASRPVWGWIFGGEGERYWVRIINSVID